MKIRRLLTSALLCVSLFASATRVVVLADLHVTPGNANESQLRIAVNEINMMSDVDLVVVDGDLTNEGSDEQLRLIKSILDDIDKPLFVIPGNHETNWSQSATKTISDLWGNDRFVTELDSLVFVGINCGPYMKMGDGHIKQEDLHWLRSTLSQRVNDGKRVISFNHYPLMKDLDNYVDYYNVLSDFPTIIHVNGHYHKYEPYLTGGINGMMVRSLDKGNGDYGYTLMDIETDSIHFYQKRLCQAPERVHSVAATKSEVTIKTVDINVQAPSGWEVAKVWSDSASIFTRIGFDKEHFCFGNSLGEAKVVSKDNLLQKTSILTGASLFSRVQVVNGVVVVPTTDKKIIFDIIADGKNIKTQKTVGPYVADGIIEDNYLYQGGYKKIEKWNALTGELVWRYDSINNYCQASPVISGDNLIFGAWDTHLYCLDKSTGKLKWKWNNGKPANMLGPGNVVPVVSGNKVVIVAPDRYMTAISLDNGKTIWRNNAHKYRESLGVSEDGKIAYAKTMDGELVAVDLTALEFKELWMIDMGIGYEHAPCIVAEKNGMIYAGSRRGIVTVIDKNTQQIVLQPQIGVSEINGIDIDPYTGDVYVSLIEGTIWRFKQK